MGRGILQILAKKWEALFWTLVLSLLCAATYKKAGIEYLRHKKQAQAISQVTAEPDAPAQEEPASIVSRDIAQDIALDEQDQVRRLLKERNTDFNPFVFEDSQLYSDQDGAL